MMASGVAFSTTHLYDIFTVNIHVFPFSHPIPVIYAH